MLFDRAETVTVSSSSARSPSAAAIRSVPSGFGRLTVTIRAPTSVRSRCATSWSWRESPTSVTSALPISFSDSSCESQRVADS